MHKHNSPSISKLFAALVAASLALGLAACSKEGPGSTADAGASGASAAAPASGGAVTVGLSISTLNNPFFVSLKKGAEDEAKKDGVTLITVDAQNDPAKQQASVEDLIEKKVNVILINPTDSSAVANVVKEATSKGIKVISLDRSVNGAEVSSHIASDNKAGGKMAADFLADKLGGKGNIVELQGIPGSSAANERGAGFDDEIAAKGGVKIVTKQPADFDRAKGLSVMENIIQSNKDIQGVFAQNDEMALGAVKALQAAGLKNVAVVGFDATDDAIAAVKAGQMAATVQQQPELIGQYGVQAAKKVVDGQPVDKFIPVPLNLYKQ
ncbi:ribose ABC transporter substrate-binding protein RbsB [Paraburkholderia sp. CNPSo 3274]|uniref:ribose ABC transporter substrate-binding protein RbsB n=1 Tax=Paraburkholderia sp. CNPSo 3274 TaxID=2940932 RepID=UPI0020B8D35A|nr:ribose ABC transporter substrate-binding protein RbsB [Paraburkholderia sp. CNPSo 3274]MCP3707212.1 ribose ABC transporter substrate-binding protein RbsB [Paraburkholderia sp. CNPSo 3274]